MQNLAVKIAITLLDVCDLSLANRQIVVSKLLDKLAARPLRDIISVNEEGQLLVNDRPVSQEIVRTLRESARSVLSNQALKIVREQTERAAISTCLHASKSDLDNYFGKAALWYGQQEIAFLKMLAGDQERELAP